MNQFDNQMSVEERSLLDTLFELISKMGYKIQTDSRELTGQSVMFSEVKVNENATYRLVVNNIVDSNIEKAISYTLTFDPHNKLGIFYDHYLENVSVHMVGVNRDGLSKPSYRECKIEVILRSPISLHREMVYFLMKTNKISGVTKFGVPWLPQVRQLSIEQARAIGRVMLSAF